MRLLLLQTLKKITKQSVPENALPLFDNQQVSKDSGSTRLDLQRTTARHSRLNSGRGPQPPRVQKAEPTEKEIQDQIRATLAKLSGGGIKKVSGAKYRREKRQANSDAQEQQMIQDQEASKTLKVTEFISANDLASMMNVSVNDVISTCLEPGHVCFDQPTSGCRSHYSYCR